MVLPSQSLAYRPTLYFWLIIFFVVFPSIYLSGKVVGCIFTVLFRVLRGVTRFLFMDEEDYEEERQENTKQHRITIINEDTETVLYTSEEMELREKERQRRRVERHRIRLAKMMAGRAELRPSTSKTVSNGKTASETIIEEQTKLPSASDHSDSLISECEDEISQATNTVSTGIHPTKETLRHRHNHIEKSVM